MLISPRLLNEGKTPTFNLTHDNTCTFFFITDNMNSKLEDIDEKLNTVDSKFEDLGTDLGNIQLQLEHMKEGKQCF